jgi:hypothetical protein
MIKKMGLWVRRKVLYPWVLKNKAEVLGLLKAQRDYRNHVTMQLYKAYMGWDAINRCLLAMGMQTVKAYYMNRMNEPYLFFEMPDAERRKQMPTDLVILRQPYEKKKKG